MTIEEKEVVPEDSKANTETEKVGMGQENVKLETEGSSGYGTLGLSMMVTRPQEANGSLHWEEKTGISGT